MAEYVIPSVLAVFAASLAFVMALTLVGGLQAARNWSDGILKYCFWALFAGNAIALIANNRSPNPAANLGDMTVGVSSIATWIIRITSLFLLISCADQIVRFFSRNPRLEFRRVLLLLTFALYWILNSLVPAYMAPHKVPLELNWFYVPVFCLGLLSMTENAADQAVIMCRNVLIAFCAASLALIPVRPDLMLLSNYTQGYIPGVPRLYGLAPHAITLGLNACIGFWCVLARPLESKAWNRVALMVCGAVLFLSQAKTSWIACLLGVPVILYYVRDWTAFRTKPLRDYKAAYFFPIVVVAVGMLLAVFYILFGGASDRFADFAGSKEGAQIFSLTGRDRIWEIALNEWRNSPWLGYGLSIFDVDFRLAVHYSGATSGHNLYIDTLSRTGLIGLSGMLLYLLVLVSLGFRYASHSRGLSLVLMLSILVRSLSEVSFNTLHLGLDSTPHYLLLVIIGGGLWREYQRRSPSV